MRHLQDWSAFGRAFVGLHLLHHGVAGGTRPVAPEGRAFIEATSICSSVLHRALPRLRSADRCPHNNLIRRCARSTSYARNTSSAIYGNDLRGAVREAAIPKNVQHHRGIKLHAVRSVTADRDLAALDLDSEAEFQRRNAHYPPHRSMSWSFRWNQTA